MNIDFRGYREKAGMTQAEVANRLGISQSQVSRYEQSPATVPMGLAGGYILVAKFVSLLSALGIGFGFSGGTAGIMALVATIGGPIVLGISLAATLAFSVWSLFGESWQKRLAKRTVKYFEEQRLCEKFLERTDQFWKDTTNGFKKGADAVEAGWKKYLELEITSERIENIIKLLEVLRNFFAGITWSNLRFDC
ncbi:MAG TPA: hypothetical protein DCP31_11645 [Cyanobacteria bacterium UBA8543]|nr:hypothetical protein [Cyanobacteria bacterium UBA8543]